MDAEIDVLISGGTWELVPTSDASNIVGCQWVFTVKYCLNGSIERYKNRMLAWGYTHTYGVDYFENSLLNPPKLHPCSFFCGHQSTVGHVSV